MQARQVVMQEALDGVWISTRPPHVHHQYKRSGATKQRDEARVEAAQAVERFATALEEQQRRQAHVLATQQQVNQCDVVLRGTSKNMCIPLSGTGRPLGGRQRSSRACTARRAAGAADDALDRDGYAVQGA